MGEWKVQHGGDRQPKVGKQDWGRGRSYRNLFRRKEIFHQERWESKSDGYSTLLWVAMEEAPYGTGSLGRSVSLGYVTSKL